MKIGESKPKLRVFGSYLGVVSLLVLVSARPAEVDSAEQAVATDYCANTPELSDYIEASLRDYPGLQEVLARYRASLQIAPQLSSLPEPMCNFTQFIRSVETRVGPQVNIFALNQKFPWFGKLDLQGQIAIKEAVILYQQYRTLERELIAEVERAYYEILFVERAQRINREEEALLDHYEKLAQTRYATGGGLQQGVIRIQSELTKLLDRAKMLEQQRETLVARLNTLMDCPPEAALTIAEPGMTPEVSLELQELYNLGEKNRQELEASPAQIEKSERTVELSKKDYWTDVTISAGFINVEGREDLAGISIPPPENGKNAFNFSIGINIPIWRNKYRAGIVEATESVYETGQVKALDLLDSERFLLSARLMQERYQVDYLKALAGLERALGTRFPRQ